MRNPSHITTHCLPLYLVILDQWNCVLNFESFFGHIHKNYTYCRSVSDADILNGIYFTCCRHPFDPFYFASHLIWDFFDSFNSWLRRCWSLFQKSIGYIFRWILLPQPITHTMVLSVLSFVPYDLYEPISSISLGSMEWTDGERETQRWTVVVEVNILVRSWMDAIILIWGNHCFLLYGIIKWLDPLQKVQQPRNSSWL